MIIDAALKRIHFIGIGGVGMSAIASVLLSRGLQITGSDLAQGVPAQRLKSQGALIFNSHRQENIHESQAQAVVISSAISPNNPEVLEAKKLKLPIFHRADLLAYILNGRMGIAVAGAHGKTTTSSMVAVMLEEAGVDPTILIGGDLPYFGSNAKVGGSELVVAEADESDGSFLKLCPQLAVVTNIENDHMDYYHTMDNVLKTFRSFLQNLQKTGGTAILCIDNPYLKEMAEELQVKVLSYALTQPADYEGCNIRREEQSTVYDAYYRGTLLGSVRLQVPGIHNVLNSVAALAVGLELGLAFDKVAAGLAAFSGVKRRFQTKGRCQDVWVVDDYAHHPTEIRATLEAARSMNPQRLVVVFQPHRYSRTQNLCHEFGSAFQEADCLLLTDIYAAGETPIPGVTAEVLQKEIEEQTGQTVMYLPEQENLAANLAQLVRSGDLVLTMGAGDVYKMGEQLVELLQESVDKREDAI